MTTREVLTEARRILTPDGAWTQDAVARDADGDPVSEGNERAVCWCVDGAVALAATGPSGWDSGAWTDAMTLLSEAVMPGRGELDPGVIAWQDAPGRTQAEVLGLLDRAIEEEG